jgi:hypothetical protein
VAIFYLDNPFPNERIQVDVYTMSGTVVLIDQESTGKDSIIDSASLGRAVLPETAELIDRGRTLVVEVEIMKTLPKKRPVQGWRTL